MRGHLRQRGEAWELRVFVGRDPTSGRKKYATRTFRGGKRDAESALVHFVDEVAGGGFAASDTTLETLLTRWFEMAREDLSPSTIRGYRLVIDRYLVPALGTVPLARLKPADIDHLYRELRAHGGSDGGQLAPATVHQVHAVLRRALQQALRWGWLATNPAALASPPKLRKTQIVPPDPSAVIALLEAAAAEDPDFGCFLHVAATTGARRGELCALTWQDIDLVRSDLLISRAIVEATHGTMVEKDTKTHASRRIALDPVTVEVLTAHRARTDRRARECGAAVGGRSYVFTRDPAGERPFPPNDITKAFIRLRDRAGFQGVRLHDLRHFNATRLLAAGVPVRTVSGRLGHANAATTLGVYAHFLEVSDREAAATMGALLSGTS